MDMSGVNAREVNELRADLGESVSKNLACAVPRTIELCGNTAPGFIHCPQNHTMRASTAQL